LQEQAERKTANHDDADDPRHAGRLEIEAVTLKHDADNRAEDNQGNQAGKDRLNQAFFDINGFFGG
jgi:hypothetical protein